MSPQQNSNAPGRPLPHRFIGRTSALESLDRAMDEAPAAILIHGPGGIGKTTLARRFVERLKSSGRVAQEALWLDFRGIRSAEHLLTRIGEALFGNFPAAPEELKLDALCNTLRASRLVIVWDNFEYASAIAGEDLALLARFLERLRDGATKVLILSRSHEYWLELEHCRRVALSVFDEDERWQYCDAVARGLGLTANRGDRDHAQLVELLGGHPLAMRIMLPQLEKHGAADIALALRATCGSFPNQDPEGVVAHEPTKSSDLAIDDEPPAPLFASLRFLEDALPEPLRPLLYPLALHEAIVDLDYLETMARLVPGNHSRPQIDFLIGALTAGGVVSHLGRAAYGLHPAFTDHLRSYSQPRPNGAAHAEDWNRAFVHVMAVFADSLTSRPPHEQQVPFELHAANFSAALADCERLSMREEEKALTQSLAVWAQNNRAFAEAERLFQRLARHTEMAAAAYHELGMVAFEQSDLASAEQWYLKSLAIWEEQRNQHDAAIAYHQLGRIAEERRDFVAAGLWYLKSLAISENCGEDHGAAITSFHLGRVAKHQGDLEAAEQWYRKSLSIRERQAIDAARRVPVR